MKKTLFLLSLVSASCAFGDISGLTAVFRNGQVFLQWQEKSLSPETRLSVYSSDRPITADNVKKAALLADMLNTNSAADWWLDVSNFIVRRTKAMRADEPFAGNAAEKGDKALRKQGFVIEDAGKPIPAEGGLHVHTPRQNETGMRYFAVVAENKGKVCGFTSLDKPVKVGEGRSVPIALKKGYLKKGAGKGLPLVIVLHGRGGGAGVDKNGKALGSHIIYSSRDFAWREGIPFKFTVQKNRNGYIQMTLNDRVWIGRVMEKNEISDGRDRVKAISTFWFGYNPNIARSIKGPEFVADNYTERYILHLIRWAQTYLGTDPAATYVNGGSMGGSGGIQLATRYPETFAAVCALVPAYAYSWKTNGVRQNGKPKGPAGFSMNRMFCSIGKFSKTNPARLTDGTLLETFVDGPGNINRPAVDIPPIMATNGRYDYSIMWCNCPPFYKAANEAKQAFSVYWNNGGHAMSGQSPADMKAQRAITALFRYRLDKAFPAFSNFSDNKKYGSGDPDEGDPVGWINRGIYWKNIADTPARFEMDIHVTHPDMKYPVTADVTFRRRQQFKFPAGPRLNAVAGGKKYSAVIDKNGLLTIEKLVFNDSKPVKIVITK